MRQTNFLFLLAAGVASAALQRLQPGPGTSPAGAAGLLARQFNTCSSRDTCHDCYGEGYVVCDTIGCFNPEIHQQCCKDALLCVGQTNKCCGDWGGPGVPGTSGVPNVTARPQPTDTPDEDTSSFTCRRGDEGEECCQRGNPPLHWCSGEFPNFHCYNAANQWCCTDAKGTVCDEEGCCELFDAEPTHPWGGPVTTAASSTTTGPVTDAPTSSAATGADADAVSDNTSTSTAGANPTQGPGLVVMGLAALGLGLL